MSQITLESTVEVRSVLDIIDEDIGPIPPYLLNLFEFLGYNTYETLKDFSLQDVDDIERFAREELCRLIGDTVEEKKKYFGAYYGYPKIFRILPGHKKLILSISMYMKGAHDDNATRERLQWNHHRIIERSVDSLSCDAEETEEFDLSTNSHTYVSVDVDDQDSLNSKDKNDSSPVKITLSNPVGLARDAKRIRLVENSSTQTDERRIRDAINRWLVNVESKLKLNIKIAIPVCYSIVFYHRPEEGKISATIECCMCHMQIGISSHRNKNGSRRWLISNFMRHVKKTHFKQHYQQRHEQLHQKINIVDIATLVKKEVE